jgi:hypothetical protein
MFLCSIDNFDVVNEINPNPNLGSGDQTTFKAWTLRDDKPYTSLWGCSSTNDMSIENF